MSGPGEIFACVIGSKTVPGYRMFHLQDDRERVRLIFPFWVLQFGDHITLVDIAFPRSVGEERGIDVEREPTESLATLGISPGDVTRVIVSHLHFDHFTDPSRFPNAEFVLQQDDLDYFGGRGRMHPAAAIAHRESVTALDAIREAGRLSVVSGDAIVDDGVRVELVGGHTPGSQIVVAELRGAPVVLACDATHFYENLGSRTPSSIINDYDKYQRGFGSIETAASGGRWYPGHDPSMLDELEPVRDGVYRVT